MKRQSSTPNLFDALDQAPRIGDLRFAAANVGAKDPESSAIAAARLERSGKRKRHCEIALSLVTRLPDSTRGELFAKASREEQKELGDGVELGRRLSDLAAVEEIAAGPTRVCRVKGTKMQVWRRIYRGGKDNGESAAIPKSTTEFLEASRAPTGRSDA